jgi:hypothetical protein
MPLGAKDLFPLGTTRLHYSTPTLVYRQIKADPGGAGWRFEHRAIVERKIGRRLDRNEHVHHKNGDTLDNRIENLELLTHSEHSRRHSALYRWAKKFDCCQECGTTERYHTAKGLCYCCWQRAEAARKGHWPIRV